MLRMVTVETVNNSTHDAQDFALHPAGICIVPLGTMLLISSNVMQLLSPHRRLFSSAFVCLFVC